MIPGVLSLIVNTKSFLQFIKVYPSLSFSKEIHFYKILFIFPCIFLIYEYKMKHLFITQPKTIFHSQFCYDSLAVYQCKLSKHLVLIHGQCDHQN